MDSTINCTVPTIKNYKILYEYNMLANKLGKFSICWFHLTIINSIIFFLSERACGLEHNREQECLRSTSTCDVCTFRFVGSSDSRNTRERL